MDTGEGSGFGRVHWLCHSDHSRAARWAELAPVDAGDPDGLSRRHFRHCRREDRQEVQFPSRETPLIGWFAFPSFSSFNVMLFYFYLNAYIVFIGVPFLRDNCTGVW